MSKSRLSDHTKGVFNTILKGFEKEAFSWMQIKPPRHTNIVKGLKKLKVICRTKVADPKPIGSECLLWRIGFGSGFLLDVPGCYLTGRIRINFTRICNPVLNFPDNISVIWTFIFEDMSILGRTRFGFRGSDPVFSWRLVTDPCLIVFLKVGSGSTVSTTLVRITLVICSMAYQFTKKNCLFTFLKRFLNREICHWKSKFV